MSRFGAGFGSAAGFFVGGIGGLVASEYIPTGGHPRNEHSLGWAGVGGLFGSVIGAAIGAGSGCVVVAKSVGTSGECIPLVSDPGLPFHLPSHPRFP